MSRQDPGRSWPLVIGAVLAVGALVGSVPAPAGAGTQDAEVTMRDNRFSAADTTVAQGQRVEFQNFGQVEHNAQDGTGLNLFATDLLEPPDAQTVGPLPGAGAYRYFCSFHPEMVGILRVPVTARRWQGRAGWRVSVRWAAAPATAGLVFDVQRRRPLATQFVDWRRGVTAAAATFRPAARGQWVIRARVRRPSDGAASEWSPVRLTRTH